MGIFSGAYIPTFRQSPYSRIHSLGICGTDKTCIQCILHIFNLLDMKNLMN